MAQAGSNHRCREKNRAKPTRQDRQRSRNSLRLHRAFDAIQRSQTFCKSLISVMTFRIGRLSAMRIDAGTTGQSGAGRQRQQNNERSQFIHGDWPPLGPVAFPPSSDASQEPRAASKLHSITQATIRKTAPELVCGAAQKTTATPNSVPKAVAKASVFGKTNSSKSTRGGRLHFNKRQSHCNCKQNRMASCTRESTQLQRIEAGPG